MRFAVVALPLVLSACGNSPGDEPPACNYNEANDVANGSAGEMTSVMLATKTQTVCGNVDGGHYDSVQKLVDVDRYRVTVGGTGELLVHLDPGDGVEALDSVRVQFFDTAVNPRLYAEAGFDKLYDHAAFVTVLPPGDYDVVVAAGAGGDIVSGQVAYRVSLTPDPSLQCKALTKPNFTEAAEASNDAVVADFTKEPSFAMGPGSAEMTKLSLAGGHHYLISGAAQAGTAEGEYVDSDVYALTTAAGVNELTVRLDWEGAAADLDFALLDAATLVPAGVSVTTTTAAGELAAFAVLPKTDYLLWVGAFQGSTGATPYGATVCAAHYTP